MKTSNIGHFVKCLGLLEKPKIVLQDQNAPKAQASRNRLTYIERYEYFPYLQAYFWATFGFEIKSFQLWSFFFYRPADGPARKNAGKSQSDNKLNKFAKRSISLAVSEFDSGLPASKKKKRS